jgi:hypothetical protein
VKKSNPSVVISLSGRKLTVIVQWDKVKVNVLNGYFHVDNCFNYFVDTEIILQKVIILLKKLLASIFSIISKTLVLVKK